MGSVAEPKGKQGPELVEFEVTRAVEVDWALEADRVIEVGEAIELGRAVETYRALAPANKLEMKMTESMVTGLMIISIVLYILKDIKATYVDQIPGLVERSSPSKSGSFGHHIILLTLHPLRYKSGPRWTLHRPK